MQLENIRDMYRYNYWANQRLLAAAEGLSPAQFVAETGHSFGSLQGTLLHTLSSEYNWLNLLRGQNWQNALQARDFPTVAALRERWQQEEAAMWAYLDGLRDEDLSGIIRYPVVELGIVRERLLWHCLFHLVNHGMQHRSEAAAILSSFGHSPGDIDFTLYLNEQPSPQRQ